MTIEIRELVIKTEIKSKPDTPALNDGEIRALKAQIIDECERVFKRNAVKSSFNR